MKFFATCAQGLEYPLACELDQLGAGESRETRAGINFEGTLETAYRAVLWSRFASRILQPLAAGEVSDTDGLYDLAGTIAWDTVLPRGCRFAVQASSRHPAIDNTHFAALRVKDAVVDQLGREFAQPDAQAPDARLYAFADADGATVGVDLSGRSLHERGYRRNPVKAPLKENVAAALLWRAGWPDFPALWDPFCGSGTLLIEAAMMAADIAPGLLDPRFGLQSLEGFDGTLWNRLVREAEERRRNGLARGGRRLVGTDADPMAVTATGANAQAAGLGDRITVRQRPIRDFRAPPDWPDRGLLATNPPYGKRLDPGQRGLFELYRVLGAETARQCPGARLAVLTAHDELAREIRLPLAERYRLFNGPIACRLFLFDAREEPAELSDGARMVANRIARNLRRLKAYLRKHRIEAYRAYDADIPEHAVAVDVYGRRYQVQEYEAPANIPEETARRRLHEALDGIAAAFDAAPGDLFVKTRARQRGSSQYGRQSEEGAEYWIREDGLEFKVNLSDYLDTGLFLDHRETRRRIRAQADGASFLNLFCYTGSATVFAAAGGTPFSISVDLSRTYLRWTRENLDRNGFGGNAHRLIRADCLQWIQRCRDRFDLIFLDPPTFSTSKAMQQAFDVQRDHGPLIRTCLKRLKPGGLLIFSTNFMDFELDPNIAAQFACEEITRQTVPPDFARGRPHRCWEIRN